MPEWFLVRLRTLQLACQVKRSAPAAVGILLCHERPSQRGTPVTRDPFERRRARLGGCGVLLDSRAPLPLGVIIAAKVGHGSSGKASAAPQTMRTVQQV